MLILHCYDVNIEAKDIHVVHYKEIEQTCSARERTR